MNIKERVESVKKDLLDYYDLSDEDVKTKLEDISAIEAELERLWRIEECIEYVLEDMKENDCDGVYYGSALLDSLKEALAEIKAIGGEG